MPLMTKEERRERHAENMRRRYRNNSKCRDLQKSSKLQKAYGITLEQYNAWSAHNGGLCSICSKPETTFNKRSGRLKLLAVDHDKKTGLVRGLLCSVCNRGIGMLRHDVTILAEAIDYLNHFNTVTVPGVNCALNKVG